MQLLTYNQIHKMSDLNRRFTVILLVCATYNLKVTLSMKLVHSEYLPVTLKHSAEIRYGILLALSSKTDFLT